MYIELRGINYRYTNGNFELKDISLQMDTGKIYCITGKNGCGKTTLGKLIAGIYRPDSGEYAIMGENTKGMPLHEFGRRIGYLFQNPEKQLFAQTVSDEITFALELKGVKNSAEICADMLKKFGLEALAQSVPVNLSRGEKQRLAMAAVLSGGPKFLMLDEPTTALDILRKKEFYEILNNLKNDGIGAAVITHDMALVENCADEIFKMDGGRLV